MKYFAQKHKEISALRLLIILVVQTFIFVFGITQYFSFIERKTSNTTAWAVSPENGFAMKMEKIPFTIQERNAEYRAHVRDFLNHWFQFDQYTFMDNINYASNLIDKPSRDKEINKYREVHLLENLKAMDNILSVVIKDISVDVTQRPYKGTFIMEQTMRTNQNTDSRIIEGIYNIEDTEGRSFENPHGAVITNFQITRSEKLIK